MQSLGRTESDSPLEGLLDFRRKWGLVTVLAMHANINMDRAWEFFVLARHAHPATWDF